MNNLQSFRDIAGKVLCTLIFSYSFPLTDFSIESLNSVKHRPRALALKKLQEALNRGVNDNIQDPEVLSTILNGLLRFIETERSSYILAKQKNESLNSTYTRLSESASLIKQIIRETAAKHDTSQFVDLIFFIFDALEVGVLSEPVCEPLADPFTRTLVSLLEVPRHLELLEYQDLQFILKKLSDISIKILESLFSHNGSQTCSTPRFPSYLTELFHAISLVLKAPIQFELSYLYQSWEALSLFMENATEEKDSHFYVIKSTIHIFHQCSTNCETEICENIIISVYKILPMLWETRLSTLRECIFTFVQVSFIRFLGIILYFDNLDEDAKETTYEAIVSLNSIFQKSSSLDSKTILKISDIDIINNIRETSMWFTLSDFKLSHDGNIQAWMFTLSYYSIRYLLSVLMFSEYHEQKAKRARIRNNFERINPKTSTNKHISNIILSDLNSHNTDLVMIRNIQFFLFYSSENKITQECIDGVFEGLYSLSQKENLELSSWAVLSINKLLIQFPMHNFSKLKIDSLWNLVNQRLYTQEFAAVGCHFIKLILIEFKLNPGDHRARIEKVISSFGSSGPKMSFPVIDLVFFLLDEIIKFPFHGQSLRDALALWSFEQIVSSNLLDLDKYHKLSPEVASSMFLAIIDVDFHADFRQINDYFYGTVSYYQGLFESHSLVDMFVCTQAYDSDKFDKEENGSTELVEFRQPDAYYARRKLTERDIYPKNFKRSLSTFLFSDSEIEIILVSLKVKLESLRDQIDNESVVKISANPTILKSMVHFVSSVFLITNSIQAKYPEIKHNCVDCVEVAIELLERPMICDLVNRDIHNQALLSGVAAFLKVGNYLNDDVIMERHFTNALEIFKRMLSSSLSSYEPYCLAAIPNDRVLHSYLAKLTDLKAQTCEKYYLLEINIRSRRSPDLGIFGILKSLLNDQVTDDGFLLVIGAIATILDSMEPTETNIREFEKLLKKINKRIEESPYIAQSESVQMFLLKILQNKVLIWAVQPSSADMKYSLASIYLVLDATKAKNKRRITPCTEKMLGLLLISIIETAGNMILDDQSVTTMLGVIMHNSVVLRFCYSSYLNKLFRSFPVQQHIEIYKSFHLELEMVKFTDVYSFILELSFLFELAISSSTLLSQLLFEMTSMINCKLPTSFDLIEMILASKFSQVANYYKLTNAKKLFTHFAPSTMFLWMLKYPITSFPFVLFGYQTEIDFFASNIDSIFILVMNNLADDLTNCHSILQDISNRASIDMNTHVKDVFHLASVARYSTVSDTFNISFKNPLNLYDSSQYSELVSDQYILILFDFFDSIDTTHIPPMIDVLEKNGRNSHLFTAYQDIETNELSIFCEFLISPSYTPIVCKWIESFIKQSTCNRIQEPRICSYFLRKLLDRFEHSIDSVERVMRFRRIPFFLSWINCNVLDTYSFFLLITSLVDHWDFSLITEEITITVREICTKQYGTHDPYNMNMFFPFSIQILARYFGLLSRYREGKDFEFVEKGITEMGVIAKIKKETLWLKILSDELTVYNHIFKILFCWLYNDTESIEDDGLSEDEFYNLLVSPTISKKTKDNIIGIIITQLQYDSSLRKSLFRQVDICPIIDDLLRVHYTLKTSKFFAHVSDEGFVYWISRFIAQQCLIESPQSIVDFYRSKISDINADGGDYKYSLFSIFSEISKRLIWTDQSISSKADLCFRILFSTENPDQLSLLKKAIKPEFLDSFGFLFQKRQHLLPNVSSEEVKSNIEAPGLWIKNMNIFLLHYIKDFASLELLIQADDTFSEQVFPYLIHMFLLCLGPNDATSNDLNLILHSCLTNSNTHPIIINLIAYSLLYLRKLKLNKELGGYKYIDIPLIDLVEALFRIKSFVNAYMFMEIYWSTCHFNPTIKMGKEEERLAFKIFKDINTEDMYYASPVEATTSSLMEMAAHENNYTQMLQFQLARLGSDNVCNSTDPFAFNSLGQLGSAMSLANNLQRCGFNSISSIIAQDFSTDNDSDLYSCAWKLQKWDLPPIINPSNQDEIAYNLLKSHNDCYSDCNTSYLDAYRSSLNIVFTGLEKKQLNSSDFKSLMIVRECEKVYMSTNKLTMAKVAEDQEKKNEYLKSISFDEAEDIILARNISWRFKRNNTSNILDVVYPLSLSLSSYSEMAVLGSATQKAMTTVIELEQLHNDTEYFLRINTGINLSESQKKELVLNCYNRAQFGLSRVLWKNKQDKISESIGSDSTKKISVENLKMLFELSQRDNTKSQINWSLIIGCQLIEWYQDSGFDRRDTVIDKYLKKTMDLVSISTLDAKTKSNLVHSLAEFCLLQYQKQNENTRLKELEKATALKSSQLQVLKEGKKSTSLDREQRITLFQGEKVLNQEIAEKKGILKTRQFLLVTSAKLFLQTAIFADRNGEDVSKFMLVWFDNIQDEVLNESVKDLIRQLPSILLLPWINQLISRLGETGSKSSSLNIEQMVINICSSHPHHGLYQLKSVTILLENKSNPEDEARCVAAQEIWNSLRKVKNLTRILDGITSFSERSIQVADTKVPSKTSRCSLNAILNDRTKWWTDSIVSLGIPSPTYHITPRSDCNYSFIPTIVSAEDKVRIAGGLSRPKIVKLNLSDGTQSVILIKGGFDDLRQDAIMEQVFNEANVFFRKYEATRKRKLSVRTYKVIPLGKLGGIIEFVKSTIPLGEYLAGAHKKYYPDSISETTAKKRIQEAANSKKEKTRIDTFISIQHSINPVLHMFFMERFFSSEAWFTSRINYIRSTAAISILGYVLGVGDRHPGNILLDQATGESVHIDLGIAFDTGKLLPCPETIPFRLTRDIIDGMGICGTSGPFELCCEHTLSVLREERTSIDTILNVLRHDPLYSW